MEVRSERRHRFAVAPDELWAAMTSVEDYRRWWPWLRGFEGSFVEGDRWECEVQPPLPYALKFSLRLEEVVAPRFVTATVHGDIIGHAAIDITPTGDGSDLRLVSVLAPANGMLRAIARVARPVVRFGHDWVLDTGVRQFRKRAF